MILKRYKEDGIIFERKAERQKRATEGCLKVEDNLEYIEDRPEEKFRSDSQNWTTVSGDPSLYVQYLYIPINYWSIPNGFC